MNEQYEILFSLPENLYTQSSPVLICAGRLLKDRQTGRKLGQLKYKNICEKKIVALTVRLSLTDAAGRSVGDAVTHTYSDLNVGRDADFGQKVPVWLDTPETCGFSACVAEVIFSDRSVWTAPDGAEWETLTSAKMLSDVFDDEELVKQYRIRFGDSCEYFPIADRDLYFCACGALNRKEEDYCRRCGLKQAELFSLDIDSLKKDRDERLAEEENVRKDEVLESAKKRMNGSSVVEYEAAIKTLEKISGWKNADELIQVCKDTIADIQAENKRKEEENRIAAEKAAKKRKRIIAITMPIVIACIAFLIVLTTVIIPKYKFNKAMQMLDSGDYDAGYAILEELGNNDVIASSKYDRAVALIDSGDYEAAYILLNGLNYKDSADKLNSIIPQYNKIRISKAQVGSCVYFGSYEQDNDETNGKEDVEWLVLEKEENKALIISKYALDCQQYNTSYTPITWETCSLRKWLNGTFVSAAFNSEEQNCIISSPVTADRNPSYDTHPGNNTTDKVFLLSIPEANRYFSSDEARKCVPTYYAIAQGANTSNDYHIDGKPTCWWWLRSPGRDFYYDASIYYDGSVYNRGYFVNNNNYAVRPAMWISLDQ